MWRAPRGPHSLCYPLLDRHLRPSEVDCPILGACESSRALRAALSTGTMAARLVLLLAELTFLLVPSAGQVSALSFFSVVKGLPGFVRPPHHLPQAAQALPASSYAARTEEETLQKLREGARNVKALGIKYDFGETPPFLLSP